MIHGAGHFCSELFATNRTGFWVGLGLIALGSGGIKPGVGVGRRRVRPDDRAPGEGGGDAFYWILAFGSFFASLLMPIFLRSDGASVGCGIPGGLRGSAMVIRWIGRKRDVRVPPALPDRHGFPNVARTALASDRPGFAPAVTGG